MLKYRCMAHGEHGIHIETSTCSICGNRDHVEKVSDLYWCEDCNVPTYEPICACGKKGKRIATDLRPVFPEERLLMEIIWNEPLKYMKSSVWNTSGNYYLIDGELKRFSVSSLSGIDYKEIKEQYQKYSPDNSYEYFNTYIDRFVECNAKRYQAVAEEAISYIRDVTKGYDATDMFVSFSGGKDSTVTSDLVMRALSSNKIVHIFGDTTLEFPETYDYVSKFKKDHPKTPIVSSRNKDKNFEELCQLIGPPSRVMRWCCTIFKTGSITRKISVLFRNKKRILAFYGIRRSESASRSKYDRESEGKKITRQVTISPIIDWMDFDIWLYLLSSGRSEEGYNYNLDFNHAYRLGYSRVGCWCCPNNSAWSEFLSKVHMTEQYEHWHTLLVDFAKGIGKKDAEDYINDGKWKARQGGNGIAYAKETSVIDFKPCALEENSTNYELTKPITEQLYELFKPFGYIDHTLGSERLGEVFIVNRAGKPMIKLQGRIGNKHLKVSIIDFHLDGAKNYDGAEEKIRCQLTKYQMCVGCRACEGVCRHGAIKMEPLPDGSTKYKIDDDKCVRCMECVNHFNAGCYMRKVLAIKRT